MNLSAPNDVLANTAFETRINEWDDERPRLALAVFPITFDDAKYGGFAISAPRVSKLGAALRVHVLRYAANVDFVGFDGSLKRAKTVIGHSKTDAVKHKPRRLLRDSQRSR